MQHQRVIPRAHQGGRVAHSIIMIINHQPLFTPAVNRPGAERARTSLFQATSGMNLHIPPDLSWHHCTSVPSAHLPTHCTLALQLPRPAAARPPHTPRRAQTTVCAALCARAKRLSAPPPHQQPCGRPLSSYPSSLHFTSLLLQPATYISPPVASFITGRRVLTRACPPTTPAY